MASAEAAVAAAEPKWWILHYGECIPDVMSRIKERGPEFEQEHLAVAKPHLESGQLLAAGALGNPIAGGMWIFRDITKEEIESSVVARDPYVREGMITVWTITPYTVVLGSLPDKPFQNEHPAGSK